MHVDWLDSDVNRPMNSHGCQRSAPSTDEDPNPSARSSQVVRLLQSRGSTLSRIPAKDVHTWCTGRTAASYFANESGDEPRVAWEALLLLGVLPCSCSQSKWRD